MELQIKAKPPKPKEIIEMNSILFFEFVYFVILLVRTREVEHKLTLLQRSTAELTQEILKLKREIERIRKLK